MLNSYQTSGTSPTIKRVTLILAALFSLLFLVALPARAQFQPHTIRETGNTLYEKCGPAAAWLRHQGAGDDFFGNGTCVGYVEGIADEETFMDLICIPPNTANNAQLVQIVWNYLDTHPATRNKPAALLVEQALMPVYPCRAGGNLTWNKDLSSLQAL